jgi:hypothetical protein
MLRRRNSQFIARFLALLVSINSSIAFAAETGAPINIGLDAGDFRLSRFDAMCAIVPVQTE